MIVVDFMLPACALGGVAVLALVLGRVERWWYRGPLLALLALGLGFGLKAIPLGAPLAAFPVHNAAVLAGWLLLGAGARAAGPWLPGPLGLQAALAGMLVGDLGGAALMAGLIKEPEGAARAALVASGAALLSPVGTPASVIMQDPLAFGLLPLMLVVVVWPRGGATPGGSKAVSALLLLVALISAFTPWAMLVAGAALCLWGRQLPWRHLLWLLGLSVVAWAAHSAGATHQFALGLDYAVTLVGYREALPLLTGAAACVALIGGELSAALLVQESLDSVQFVRTSELRVVLAAGVGVGGIVGGLPALRLWWRQVAVLLLWVVFAV